MGTTSKGYPYPEPTDPVAAGADNIKALAEMIDSRLGASFASSVSVSGDGTTVNPGVAVTFPVGRFTAAPRVTATVNAGAATFLAGIASGVTAAGCTVNMFRRDGAVPGGGQAANVHYIAVQAL